MVRKENDEYLYLLLRAYNYWDFPKGVVENGEDPLNAALREVAEETGIEDLKFHWGHPYLETELYGVGKVARYYLAETSQIKLTLPNAPGKQHPEHHEYQWLQYDQTRERLVPRVQRVIDWAHSIIKKDASTV